MMALYDDKQSTTRKFTSLVICCGYAPVGKSGFVSHTKHIAEATNMDLFHS